MKKYEKYKDSGVEWLGEIPEHWKLNKLKNLLTLNDETLSENTPDDYIIQYVEISDVKQELGIHNSTLMPFAMAPSRARRKVKTGDIIVSTVRTYLKAIARINDCSDNLIVSTGFAVLRPKLIESDFLGYIMISNGMINEIICNSVGVSYPAINASQLVNIQIPVPSIPEQTRAANYLDNKTTIINQLITEKESLITKLQEKRKALINEVVTKGLNPNAPMRDSGIEWLGMIPEHWGINELKRYVDFVQTGTTPSTEKREYFENPTFNWFTPSDFNDNNIYLTESKRKVSEIAVNEQACRVFPENTVLLIGIGATLGKVGISQNICSANQQINAIIFNQVINPVFGAYYLSSIKEIIVSMANAATLAILNQSNTKEIPITCPPIEEQSAIVNFIESRTTKIDATIGEIQLQLQKLKEYKTAVISEVVTGKVDVREWKVPKHT